MPLWTKSTGSLIVKNATYELIEHATPPCLKFNLSGYTPPACFAVEILGDPWWMELSLYGPGMDGIEQALISDGSCDWNISFSAPNSFYSAIIWDGGSCGAGGTSSVGGSSLDMTMNITRSGALYTAVGTILGGTAFSGSASGGFPLTLNNALGGGDLIISCPT